MDIAIIHTPRVVLRDITGVERYNELVRVCENLPRLDQAFRMDLASVTEYIDVVFYIECSRIASHQLVRHRLVSYVQLSQRRTVQRPVVLLPRSLAKKMDFIEEDLKVAFATYNEAIKAGIAPELARYVLPQCCLTALYMKTNLRELAYIINVRMCKRAQPETRYIAMKMAEQLWQRFPELREVLAPYCCRFGHCKYNPNVTEKDKLRKCREQGYRVAILEHGTDEEVEKVDEIIAQLP